MLVYTHISMFTPLQPLYIVINYPRMFFSVTGGWLKMITLKTECFSFFFLNGDEQLAC